jgi:hypothetical protein
MKQTTLWRVVKLIILLAVCSICLDTYATAREFGRQGRCKNNLKIIGTACLQYIDEEGGGRYYPKDLRGISGTVLASEQGVFICPSSRDRLSPGRFVCSYECIFELAQKHLEDSLPPDMLMVWDKPGNHRGLRGVAFADTHMEFVREAEFQLRYAGMRMFLDTLNQGK